MEQPSLISVFWLSFLFSCGLFWYSPTYVTALFDYEEVTPWAQLLGSMFGLLGGLFFVLDMKVGGLLVAPGSAMFVSGAAVLMRVRNINPDPKSLWESETTGYALLVAGAILMGLGIR